MKFKIKILILMISCISIASWGGEQKGKKINNIIVKSQKDKKRIYFKVVPKLIKRIIFETSLDSTIYRPDFCKCDKSGNVYVMDYSTFYIHKFSLVNGTNNYTHTYFGNGKGKGPGEFVNPTDFDIYNDNIYITDPSNGCIEIYSTKGKYLERITLNNNIIPQRIEMLDGKMLVTSQRYNGKELFYFYSYDGDYIESFGEYIDKTNLNNGVYHDYDIIRISSNSFCYMPYYLGFMGFYRDGNLQFVRTTIDGLKEVKSVHKEVVKGLYVTKIEKEFETAAESTCNGEYLLLKAVDIKNDKNYFDLYDINSLKYVKSINGLPPDIYSFSLNGKLLAAIDNYNLYIYDLEKILK